MPKEDIPVIGEGRDRYLTLLGLIALTFMMLMLVDIRSISSAGSDILFVAVTATTAGMLVAALWTSRARTRLLRLGIIFGALMTAGSIITVLVGANVSNPPIIWVLLLIVTPVVVIRDVASHKRVHRDTIIGAVCGYLLIALAFSYVFLWIDILAGPFFAQAEPSTSFPYFSLVTITTLGYGDLAPVTELGRALSTSEAIIGQVFLVVFVARLVSISSAGSRERNKETSES